MEVLPGIWSLSPLAALVGVLVLQFWFLATGRIITRGSHDRELGLTTRRGDEWKETAVQVRAVNSELLKQNSQLIEGNRIADHFFRSASEDPDTLTRPKGGDPREVV